MDSKLLEHGEPDEVGLVASWRGDGRGLLTTTALGLLAAGLFAWFLAVTDRAAFGGTLTAISVLYLWLIRF